MVLGIIQLIGLNLAGIFWMIWARGIEQRKRASRNWVLFFHGSFLVVGLIGLPTIFCYPQDNSSLFFYSKELYVGPVGLALFILAVMLIYALPFFWLLKPEVEKEFN